MLHVTLTPANLHELRELQQPTVAVTDEGPSVRIGPYQIPPEDWAELDAGREASPCLPEVIGEGVMEETRVSI